MLMKPTKMMTSLKLTMMVILFTSTFFFQTTHMKTTPSNNWLGITHNPSFSTMKKSSLFFTTLLKTLAFSSLIPLTMKIYSNTPDIMITLANWLPKKTSKLTIQLHFDLKFNTFLSMALFVSWSILEFSHYYMQKDPTPKKFFRLLMIFLLKMIMLTCSKKMFIMFMGWEGVGFLSFLLMSWWSSRTKAKNSAMQAVIYKRLGDIGLLLFFSLTITLFKSWSLSEIKTSKLSKVSLNLLLLGALMAAAGKSAQFGLHPWLPAAMEGPTPVSALLHSSTMVVAGMFLLIRLSPLYSKTKMFKTWCLTLGSLTAMFAATTAMAQHDIKKMMAYSTTSQLGLMMVAMGLKQPNLALFHICTHAFFKAMLFLSSGSIIHSLKDEQDIRKMGGLHLLLPKTSACMILGSLALSGMPFLAGFYSKDLILELGLTNLSNFLGLSLSLLATLLTSVYSLRIMFFCFLKDPSFFPLSPTKEENQKLTKSLKRLATGTILSGWIISSFMLFNPMMTISTLLKSTALLLTLMGVTFTLSMTTKLTTQPTPEKITSANFFTSKQWFYENLLHIIFLSYSFMASLTLSTRKMDRGWKEKMGAQGMATLSSSTSQKYQLSQTGYMKQYMLFSFITFTAMVLAALTLT